MDLPQAEENGFCPLDTAQLAAVFLQMGEMLSGKSLFTYQKSVALTVYVAVMENDGSTITAEFSRQSGKSEVVSTIIGALMVLMPLLATMYPQDTRFNLIDTRTGRVLGYARGFQVSCFGPKKEQADIIYGRVKEFFNRDESQQILAAMCISFSVSNGKNCVLTNGSVCSSSTANEGASIEGGSCHLIVTDETQRIVDLMIRKSILPMGASTNAVTVHLGTASIGKCHFYYAIQQNKRTFALGGAKRHYEVDCFEAAAENQFYAKHVEQAKSKLGENSDEFLMSYRNKWILERGQFIDEPRLKGLRDPNRGFGDYHTPGKNLRRGRLSCIAGIDFAKQHDRTVLSIGLVDYDNPVFEKEIQNEQEWRIITYFAVDLVELVSFDGDDYETQFHIIKDRLDRLPYPLKRMALDATGCGASICDRFKATYSNIDIIEYVFTLQSKDHLYRNYTRMVRAGEYRYPGNAEALESRDYVVFAQEHVDLEKTYQSGLMVVHHPDEPGAHDDYPDSSALLCWAGSDRPLLGEVEVSDSANLFGR